MNRRIELPSGTIDVSWTLCDGPALEWTPKKAPYVVVLYLGALASDDVTAVCKAGDDGLKAAFAALWEKVTRLVNSDLPGAFARAVARWLKAKPPKG